MSNRWKMNRMGFVNFWLYDEETFLFSDGKLLLRGQNGSGKSITTQSFIPFILDGDRSPSRLDPFGSSDRRMEYYFLGESGKEESTGYLFLEFKKENLEQYRTIGIGQKAQKGKPMSFWGFVILDGRRVGQDINLYKEAGMKKIPYTRQELKQVLGEGNPCTEAQREYMELVNRHIFGFPNIEQYGQFIKLLIKVRAPKLSKEFKPTKVYEILNDSLQTLSDEDLRAMVEAMEKMDDIQSRLEGLKSAYKDLQIIRNEYLRYNLYMLGKKAQAYVEKKKSVDGLRRNLTLREHTLEEECREIEQCKRTAKRLEDEIQILTAEKDSLHLEDMEESIDKLEKARKDKNEAEDEKRKNDSRIETARGQILFYDGQLRTYQGRADAIFQEIEERLQELEEENEILLFAEHGEVRKLIDSDNRRGSFQEISRSLKKLADVIEQGYKVLERLDQIWQQWNLAEEELQKYTAEKERAEAEYSHAESMERECKDQLIEEWYVFSKENQEMLLTSEELGGLSERIQSYDSPENVGKILELCHQMWMKRYYALENSRLETKNEQRECLKRKETLLMELKALENMPMAAPARKKRTEEARKILREKGIPFVPFYEAVDFADGVSEDEKKRIEGQIEASGLLDALLIPTEHQEKARGVLKELSDAFLSTDALDFEGGEGRKKYPFLVSEELEEPLKQAAEAALGMISDRQQSDAVLVIAEDGYFRNGALEGYCHAEEEAAYIGAAARKRKKEEMLQEKRAELADTQKELEDIEESLEAVTLRIQRLNAEKERFPSFDDLNEAINLMRISREKWDRCRQLAEEQEKAAEKLREAHKAMEQQVLKLCRPLPYYRTLDAYKEAGDSVKSYQETLEELEHAISDWEIQKSNACHTAELIEKEEETIDRVFDYLRQAERRIKEAAVQIQRLEEYLNNPQIKEMRERLEQIKEELAERRNQFHENDKNLAVLAEKVKGLEEEISSLKENAVAETDREGRLRAYFEEELALKLIMEQGETPVYEAAVKAQTMVRETDRNRSGAEMTTALMKTFHAHLGTLTSYGTAMEECFAGGLQDSTVLRTRQRISAAWNGRKLYLEEFYKIIKESIESTELLIQQKDRELFEGILADTLSRKLSSRIRESRNWIKDMSALMKSMDTSMALTFSLEWKPKGAEGENELDTQELEKILGRERELLTTEDMDKVSAHFRTRIHNAKRAAEENGEVVNYIDLVRDALDYRKWFVFQMHYYRNDENRKELTNGAFNRFSGGEKAMAMYVPLFAAVNAQYKKAENKDHPRIIALDEAFAGVDDKNISSMFELVEKLDFDYIMNSQVLWGCYETVKNLRIAELLRPANADVVTVIYYRWNGCQRMLDEQ